MQNATLQYKTGGIQPRTNNNIFNKPVMATKHTNIANMSLPQQNLLRLQQMQRQAPKFSLNLSRFNLAAKKQTKTNFSNLAKSLNARLAKPSATNTPTQPLLIPQSPQTPSYNIQPIQDISYQELLSEELKYQGDDPKEAQKDNFRLIGRFAAEIQIGIWATPEAVKQAQRDTITFHAKKHTNRPPTIEGKDSFGGVLGVIPTQLAVWLGPLLLSGFIKLLGQITSVKLCKASILLDVSLRAILQDEWSYRITSHDRERLLRLASTVGLPSNQIVTQSASATFSGAREPKLGSVLGKRDASYELGGYVGKKQRVNKTRLVSSDPRLVQLVSSKVAQPQTSFSAKTSPFASKTTPFASKTSPFTANPMSISGGIGGPTNAPGVVPAASDSELQNILDNLKDSKARLTEEMKAGPGLLVTLRPYQRQALSWMVNREAPVANENKSSSSSSSSNSPSSPSGDPSTRLPPGWQELTTSTGKKYYLNKTTNQTTWQFPYAAAADSQPRKALVRGGILADEMGMGKTIEILALCATNRPDASGPRATLIVCPLSVLHQWKSEIEKRVLPRMASLYVYHGTNRTRDTEAFEKYDFVLTTYATLATELPIATKKGVTRLGRCGMKKGPLLNAYWLRIVLDEAHTIKDRTTRTAKASFALKAERRWCVTGTPVQNKLDDLFSLLHFLKVDPYGDYTWWNQVILRPIRNRDERGFMRLQAILQTVLIRRTKDMFDANNAPIVALPPRIVKLRRDEFTTAEKDFYTNLWRSSKVQFEGFQREGTLLKNYAHILELLLRLRQACNHPDLVLNSSRNKSFAASENKLSAVVNRVALSLEGEAECSICLEAVSLAQKPIVTICGHLYCKRCIEANARTSNKCPLCRHPLKPNDLISIDTSVLTNPEDKGQIRRHIKSNLPQWNKHSTKINALMQALGQLAINERGSKSIVFSQWTSMLDLIEKPLREANIRFVRLDGTMSQNHREQNVNTFNTNPDVTVFLISMKAGGLGLNLTVANYVFLLDPWWNPATEEQAIDRVHRIGQKKPVIVTRFVIRGTVEERILELQDKKRMLAQGALGVKRKELQQMRIDELKLLFSDGMSTSSM